MRVVLTHFSGSKSYSFGDESPWKSVFCVCLIEQPDRQRIVVHMTFARFQRGDDYKNNVENVQDREKSKTDQQETENASHKIVDQHRDLKVQRLFPVRVDFGSFTTLDQPNNERSKDVSKARNDKPRQRTEMARYAPGPDVPYLRSFTHP
jgi:hypothetical protein